MGCHSLLQGIFLTQGWNPGLLHCRQILYRLSHQYHFAKETGRRYCYRIVHLMQEETQARGVKEPRQGHTGWSWGVALAHHMNPKARLISPQRVFREHAMPQVGPSGRWEGI